MAPSIVLLMHFPIFRCNVSTNWLRKLPRPQMPSIHGQSSSWRTPQPLPKIRGCYSNMAGIPSRNQSTPSVLCSLYYPTLPSFTTYPTLFLLLYGLPGFLQNHQGISCWYSPWTPGEALKIQLSCIWDHKVLKLVLTYPLPSQSSKRWSHSSASTHPLLRNVCSEMHLPWPSTGFWEPVSLQLHPWSGSMYRGLATRSQSSLSSLRQTHSIVAIQ